MRRGERVRERECVCVVRRLSTGAWDGGIGRTKPSRPLAIYLKSRSVTIVGAGRAVVASGYQPGADRRSPTPAASACLPQIVVRLPLLHSLRRPARLVDGRQCPSLHLQPCGEITRVVLTSCIRSRPMHGIEIYPDATVRQWSGGRRAAPETTASAAALSRRGVGGDGQDSGDVGEKDGVRKCRGARRAILSAFRAPICRHRPPFAGPSATNFHRSAAGSSHSASL